MSNDLLYTDLEGNTIAISQIPKEKLAEWYLYGIEYIFFDERVNEFDINTAFVSAGNEEEAISKLINELIMNDIDFEKVLNISILKHKI